MRIAIIGQGGIGQRHARNFAALGCSVRTYDPRGGESYDLGEGVVFAKPSLEAALDGSHGCVIATPPDSHVEIAWQALGAGCHLMLEKPVSLDLTDLGHLFAACERAGKVHMVAYPWRYDPEIQMLRAQAPDAGATFVRAHYGYAGPNATARAMGPLLDCSHIVDLLRFVLGEVADLTARTDGDNVDLYLRFEGGTSGYVRLGFDPVVEIERLVEIAGWQKNLSWHRSGQPAPNEMYLEEARHFLACIRGEAKPMTDGWDARETLRVCLAAQTAARERRWIAR